MPKRIDVQKLIEWLRKREYENNKLSTLMVLFEDQHWHRAKADTYQVIRMKIEAGEFDA